jgi:hypothetical protein
MDLLMRSRSLSFYIMAPTPRKAVPKAKVGKSQADPKKAWEEKLYFLWLHFQMKHGDKVLRTLLNSHRIIPGSLGLF